MTLHVHHLTGCSPAPLAFYLKGLAVLRLVSEQKDPEARGWWQDEHFWLLTRLDRSELEQFFLEEYAPTPFVSPWNKGSGFFESDAAALRALEASRARRFSPFRAGIAAGRAELPALSAADNAVRSLKDRTKKKKGMTPAQKAAASALKKDEGFKKQLAEAERRFKQIKAEIVSPMLRSWRGGHRDWLDAALVLLDDGRLAWPALLGTGGNDGRLDFTNNAMQQLGKLFDLTSPNGQPTAKARGLLNNSLWGELTDAVGSSSVGQFLPGTAGGANTTTAPEGASFINAWDFVLMLEGSVLFSSRATRRLDPGSIERASAPFAVRSHAAGYGSRGGEGAERGEQWMPLWSAPATAEEVRSLLGEARLQLGRQAAYRPVDVARAVGRLGAARGVVGFVRFGYLERNGRSKIAVPLGRIDVIQRVRSRLVDDIAPWLDGLRRASTRDGAPARFAQAEGKLADAVLAALTHDDAPARWQQILLAAADIESIQASGSGFEAGPIPPLDPEWVRAACDGSAEFRLARALGSAAAKYGRDSAIDSVRNHWLPLESGSRFAVREKRLLRIARVVATGRDAVADLLAIVERRLIEAAQHGERSLALVAARGCGAHPADLTSLIGGQVDLARVVALARALMAVRWNRWTARNHLAFSTTWPGEAWPGEAWIALRLAHLPWSLDGRLIGTDESIVRRLASGDGGSAVESALRRLRAAGLSPPLVGACTDPATARLWGAALAFPIDRGCAREMTRYF